MHVIDNWPTVPVFQFFAFPSEGYYPLELIESHYAWSIHIHSSQAQRPAGNELKVGVSLLDEHFRTAHEFETKVVGIIPDAPQTPDRPMHVIVFKPDFRKGKMAAGKYLVQVAGLKGPKGAPLPIQYVVELVRMPFPEGGGDESEKDGATPGPVAAKPTTKPTIARPGGAKR
jgi:hypothetical protein